MSTVRNLLIVLFALVAIMIGLELSDTPETAASGALYPDFRNRINDVQSIVVDAPGAESVHVAVEDGVWTVAEKGGYPASLAKIREVLLAIADAQILEQKTANPERYASLGVRDPEVPDSAGRRITLSGAGVDLALIIGNQNQTTNRYVRIAGEAQSLLIDADPKLPDAAAGWLQTDLLDIDGAEVRSVEIRHADDEAIRLSKTTADDTNFVVADIPEGRELSYATVANGIGSALADLALEDVRRSAEGDVLSTTIYDTFDGRRIALSALRDGETTWIAVQADYDAARASTDAVTEDADAEDGEMAVDEEVSSDPSEEIAALVARTSGWQFKLPEFKKNQLTRRWEDILQAEDDAEE